MQVNSPCREQMKRNASAEMQSQNPSAIVQGQFTFVSAFIFICNVVHYMLEPLTSWPLLPGSKSLSDRYLVASEIGLKSA